MCYCTTVIRGKIKSVGMRFHILPRNGPASVPLEAIFTNGGRFNVFSKYGKE